LNEDKGVGSCGGWVGRTKEARRRGVARETIRISVLSLETSSGMKAKGRRKERRKGRGTYIRLGWRLDTIRTVFGLELYNFVIGKSTERIGFECGEKVVGPGRVSWSGKRRKGEGDHFFAHVVDGESGWVVGLGRSWWRSGGRFGKDKLETDSEI
jgi:hypothetical protein